MLALDPVPLTTARVSEKRVVGTCRHFAVKDLADLCSSDDPAAVSALYTHEDRRA
ncbi:hypothetical protein ACFPN7_07080 [Amycolatopsis halotolerans]|uniref:hypothetical protein n=1 Tax=Amycolatopsis halotolerans TaxID=330083 RepID=UPI003615FC20